MARILAASLLMAVLVAGCGTPTTTPAPTRSSPTPSTVTAAPAAPTPGASPFAAVPLVCGEPGGTPLDLATCLRVLGPASVALEPGRTLPTRIVVTFTNPSESTPRELLRTVVDGATVTVRGFMPSEWLVDIIGDSYRSPIRVYEGSRSGPAIGGDFGLGAAPKQVRLYTIDGSLASWSDPASFELEEFTYDVSGGCSGTPEKPGQGTVRLERIATDGTAVEVLRAHCGPAPGPMAFGEFVTVEAGMYRMRIEDVLEYLDVTLWPRAAWR